MKLLFYTNVLGGGGAERVMVNLANYFANQMNAEIFLFASYPYETEYEISDNVTVKYLDSDISEDSFFRKNYNYIKQLRSFIKEASPDVVLSFLPESNIRVLVASMGLGIKKVVSIRNNPKQEYSNFFYRILAKSLYGFADAIVFQTQEQREFFPKNIQKKSVIIMNQVNEKFFKTDIVEERKNIVAVGRLYEQKNYKLLIEAFSKISNQITDNLIIYGDGPLREELLEIIREKNLTERIILAGRTSDVIGAIKNAKVYVLSSDYEGMPNALLEAMALGLPCISTDCPCGGPREIISDGENGFLVPVNNADSLAEKMLELVKNEELQKEFSKKARESAERFKPEKIFLEWEKVLLNK